MTYFERALDEGHAVLKKSGAKTRLRCKCNQARTSHFACTVTIAVTGVLIFSVSFSACGTSSDSIKTVQQAAVVFGEVYEAKGEPVTNVACRPEGEDFYCEGLPPNPEDATVNVPVSGIVHPDGSVG